MGKRKRESSVSSTSSSSSSDEENKRLRKKLQKYKDKYIEIRAQKVRDKKCRNKSRKDKENIPNNRITAGEAESERYRSHESLVPGEGTRSFLPSEEGELSDDKGILESGDEFGIETIILDEPSEIPTGEQVSDPLSEQPFLSSEVLQALGKEVNASELTGDTIHRDLVTRWESILKHGLGVDPRQELVAKYPPIKNCPLVAAPKLNLEVKSAVNEITLKRDERLAKIQTQVGAGLSALGKALSMLVGQGGEGGSPNLQLIEAVSDAARLLADVHFQDTESRRTLVSLNLNKDLTCTLTDVAYDGWLFGENLGERVKAAKAIERSGQELKNIVKTKRLPRTSNTGSHLNSRTPSRPSTSHRLGGHQRQYNRNRYYKSLPYHHNRDQAHHTKVARTRFLEKTKQTK